MPPPGGNADRIRRAVVVVGVSVLAHAPLWAGTTSLLRTIGGEGPYALAAIRPAAERVRDDLERPERLRAARRELVAQAREARRASRLELGDFLLRASALDAAEAGRALDLVKLRLLYGDRVAALRGAVRDGRPLPNAVADTFADLEYVGRAGGIMADVLLERSGSCEPLSHLVVAAMYDAGHHARAHLRVYGGVGDAGVAHVTAIDRDGDAEIDLLLGAAPEPGGALLAAEDIVEVYAIAHGIAADGTSVDGRAADGTSADGTSAERTAAAAPASNGSSAPTGSPATVARAHAPNATLSFGYPANADVFPGALPLFSRRAVKEPPELEVAAPGAPTKPAVKPDAMPTPDCTLFVPMALLDPPQLAAMTGARGDVSVEPHKIPSNFELERRSNLLEDAERAFVKPDATEAERIVTSACLRAQYERIAVDFALVGKHALSRAAVERATQSKARGDELLASVTARSLDARREVQRAIARRYPGKEWVVMLLAGGDAFVLEHARAADAANWGSIVVLAALVVHPSTRADALELVAALGMKDRVDVLHEVFHAHDHLRPWSASFPLEDALTTDATSPGAAEVARAYAVFRRLAFRLWEAQSEPAEIVAALDREAADAELGAEWSAAMLSYYGHNLLGLHQHRGIAIVGELRAALGRRDHPALKSLVQKLDYLDQVGKLDIRTLSDAYRVTGD